VVADHTADLLFAPTEEAVKHLEREGLAGKTVMTGDIMADSVQFVQSRLGENKYAGQDYYLLTMHRPYNVDDPKKLRSLFKSLGGLSKNIIFPIHPRSKKILDQHNITVPDNIELIKPQGYVEFQGLLKFCEKVITDSGGLQKEAYIAGKPCITLRPETEWVETVDVGWNTLMDIESEDLAEKIQAFTPSSKRPDLYGKNVARTMVAELERFLK